MMPRSVRYSGNCSRCARAFQSASPNQRYCSLSCAARQPRPNRRRSPLQPRACQCGAVFTPKSPRVRFCSAACGHRLGGRTYTNRCEECGCQFETRIARQRFCSRPCQRQARLQHTERRCAECGSTFKNLSSRVQFCSTDCARARGRRYRAANSPNWRGGRTRTTGYVRRRAPGHPRTTPKNPYVLEHILVIEGQLGRYLEPHERVHHKNGRRDDNRPENLELWKIKDPPGVRASDYHCAGCRCPRIANDSTR